MSISSRSAAVVATALTCAVTLAGCGSSSSPSTAPIAESVTASAAVSTTTAAPSASNAAALSKVDANTATLDELTTALESAGVANSAKMAKEVEEYRPYTQTDMSSKLGEELGKYGVDSASLAKILSVLTV